MASLKLNSTINIKILKQMDLNRRITGISQPSQQQRQQRKFNQYLRNVNTAPRGAQIPRYSRKKVVPIENSKLKKSNVDKYYRTDSAPKSQFNRYLMDTVNIFYEDRQSARQLENIDRLKKITMVLFPILLVTFFLINLIQPYPGQCPKNARCGVYIHCNAGYQLSHSGQQCLVSEGIIDEAENLCFEAIQQLIYDYGDRQCQNEEYFSPPHIHLDEIFEGLTGQTAHLVKEKSFLFLQDEENQKKMGFNYFAGKIMANEKKQSFSCKIKLFFKSYAFFVGVPIVLVTISLIGYAHLHIGNVRRARAIYKEIRSQVLRDKIVNITNITKDLQERHGEIDENLWRTIDSCRTKDRDIGYLQDDFLYWKLI